MSVASITHMYELIPLQCWIQIPNLVIIPTSIPDTNQRAICRVRAGQRKQLSRNVISNAAPCKLLCSSRRILKQSTHDHITHLVDFPHTLLSLISDEIAMALLESSPNRRQANKQARKHPV